MRGLLLIMGLSLFLQCRRDEITPTPHKDRPGQKTVLVNSSVFGMAVDERGDALKQASVAMGRYRTTTDDKGFFLFKDILMDRSGTAIEVEAPQYFKGVRVVRPDLNSTSAILVHSAYKSARRLAQLPSAQVGGEVMASDVALDIPAYAIEDAQGNRVEDAVNIYIHRIDPESTNTFIPSPGMYTGEDKDYAVKTLFPYGIIAVELQRPNGEVLHFSNDTGVKTQIPLPKTLVSSAPAFIPLWYFDASKAKWVETGVATLTPSGDAYEATIDKDGYWSVQSKGEPVSFSTRILDSKGAVATYLRVDLVDERRVAFGGVVASGGTDNKGAFHAVVRSDLPLRLKAYNTCGQLVDEHTIGPFPAGKSADIGDYYLQAQSNAKTFQIAGTLYDCDWKPISGGSVRLKNTLYPYSSITDDEGYFSLSGTVCSRDPYVELEGYDAQGEVQSTSVFFLPESDVNMGPMAVCDLLRDSSVAVRLDGEWIEMDDYESYFKWSSRKNELEWTAYSKNNISITIRINDISKGIGGYTVDDNDNVNYRVEFDDTSEIGRSVPGETTIRIVRIDNQHVYGAISQGQIGIYDFNNNLIRKTRVDVFFKLPLP